MCQKNHEDNLHPQNPRLKPVSQALLLSTIPGLHSHSRVTRRHAILRTNTSIIVGTRICNRRQPSPVEWAALPSGKEILPGP